MKASAPGKLILFGEHSVVYDKLGIATAINLHTTAKANWKENGSKIELNDRNHLFKLSFEELSELLNLVEQKIAEQKIDEIVQMQKADYMIATKAVVAKVIHDLQIEKPFELNITSEIPIAAGLGSGSSCFASISAALQKLVNKNLDIKLVEKHSYFGDVICHGRPSGIDNNTVTYGKYIKFRKSIGVVPIQIDKKLSIVIGNTKVKGATAQTVAHVKKLRDEKPEYINGILDQMEEIANLAIDEIEKGDLQKIGMLMNQNHKCLQQLEVSHPKLEELVQIALENKAFGAKLTGGGGGGNMYALCKNTEHQKKVAEAFENAGYKAIITKIGAGGVK